MGDAPERTAQRARDGETGSPPHQAEHAARPAYQAPKLIRYGHVKELTAGTKGGTNDISLNSSIV